MTKQDFLTLMRFPSEWLSLGMYPDELFEWQVAGYQPGHEEGAEHDRNGAFHWWLRRSPTSAQLAKLLQLAAVDPDDGLGSDVRRYVLQAANDDQDVLALDAELSRAKSAWKP